MISEPNFWRVEYLVSMGKFDTYEKNTKTVDNLKDFLYTVARDKIIQITPLFVTEYKHPVLTKNEVEEKYTEVERDIKLSALNGKLNKGLKMVEEAKRDLAKFK